MNIKLFIFNIITILFICFLIYLYLYINYNYEGFKIEEDTLKSNYLNKQERLNIINPQLEEIQKNGTLNNAIDSRILPYFNFSRIANNQNQLSDNYYWVTLPDIGDRLIYCIMDTNYFGGGWMLAMRAVRGSRTFGYHSSYWTNPTSTLNSDHNAITNAISPIGGETVNLNISSIGNKIFNDYTGNNAEIDKLDAKFDTFNKYAANEWMAIFYFRNNSGIIYKGGDDLTNITSQENKKGWIWYETNVALQRNVAVPPVQIFSYLSTNFSQMNSLVDLKSKYGVANAKDLKKFYSKPLNYPQLWSSQSQYNFYGLNYEIPSHGQSKSNVRWGFAWNENWGNPNDTNDVYSGIGSGYRGGYSAGDFIDCCQDNVGVNSSIAFEWYVR